MAEKKVKAEADGLQVNEKKWTPTLMKAGWTVLPNVLFERQQALGLDPLDINILLHIASYWWSEGSKPHPSKTTIAKAIGIEPRSVQRRIAALEKDKLKVVATDERSPQFRHPSKSKIVDSNCTDAMVQGYSRKMGSHIPKKHCSRYF